MNTKLTLTAAALIGFAGYLSSQASPDLVVTTIVSSVTTHSQTLAASGSLAVAVRNNGAANATGAIQVLAFEDRNFNAAYDSGVDNAVGTATIPGGVAAGAVATVNIPIAGTLLFKGNILYAMADSASAVVESNETNNLRHTGQNQVLALPADTALNPQLKWIRDTFPDIPASRGVTNTPVAGDVNGDGTPDVVFTTYDPTVGDWLDGVLRVVSGDTGAPLLSVTDPTLQLQPAAGIALADIDQDGRTEMIAIDEGCRLIVFEHDGDFKWRAANQLSALGQCWMTPAVADLDRNGTVEIVVGNQAFSASGALLWTGAGATGGFDAPGTAVRSSVIADLDLDGNLEVIAGPTAYRADGSIYWNKTGTPFTLTDGLVAVGNFDADANPEIVVRPNLQFETYLLEHDGTVKWVVTPPNPEVRAGPPVVADFDNDGQPEIGIADRTKYTVFETNGAVKWTRAINDTSSGVTGSSVFDFNHDGVAEVVFADETTFFLVRGTDGAILNQFPRSSGTAIEMPVVADVDGDGRADVVVPANPYQAGSDRGVRVYSGGNGNWAATRKVWNQHAYSVTNINENLTVPVTVTPNWLTAGLNNFRANALLPGSFLQPSSAPDLVPSLLRRVDAGFPAQSELVVRIGNGGSAPAGPHRVEFRNGPGGALLAAANTTRTLAPGEFEDVHAIWPTPTAGQYNIVATADTLGQVNEGDESNNQCAAQLVIGQGPAVTVDDLTARFKDAGVDLRWTPVPGAASYNVYQRTGTAAAVAVRNGLVTTTGAFSITGLTNNTTYHYNVRFVNAAGVESPLGTESSATPIPRTQRGDTPPTITTAPVTRGRTGAAYLYQPTASDPDAGEVLTWSLDSPPSGMTIQSATGRIAWTPGGGQGGAYRIQLRVTDSRARSATQSFNLFIETQILNNAPMITSTPLSSGVTGRLYSYSLRAVDPDSNDVLTFSRDAGPTGLTIHPSTGLAQWTPAAAGVFPVTLRVTDLAGATVTQAFSITVQNQNRPPVITSAPGTTVTAQQTYAYTPAATDPDAGDTRTWSLPTFPNGMTVNPTTGVVLWTPTAAQVGQHVVTLQVRDALGATASQTWTIHVAAIINLPPTITSIAPTQASVNGLYSYQATATDAEGDSLLYSLPVAPAGMTVSPSGLIQWTPNAGQAGSANVTLRVADTFGNAVNQNFVITVNAADTTPPTVTIHSPTANSTVTGDLTITGTVTDANLVSWELEYQVLGGSGWTRLASGNTGVTNQPLAQLAASLLADNPYLIRLVGRDQAQSAIALAEIRVKAGEYKPGAFRLSFDDMRVPTPGLPIVMHRIYDSTKPYANDFGPGWSLSYGEFDLRVDLSYNVFVTLPSGRRVTFTFSPVQSNPVFPTLDNQYLAPAASGDELINLDCPQFFGGSQGLLCLGGSLNLQQYNPRNFRLKTREGITFLLADGRVTEVQDRAGNRTLVTPTAITSWTGRNVTISRDGQGRITQIADPRGSRLTYAYDASGRLASVQDQLGRVTTFGYFGSTHLLNEIRTPGGCTGSRQEFDASGRLTATVDAAGNRTQYAYDVTGRTRTVTDPTGAVYTETYDAQGNLLTRNDGTGRVTTYTYDASNRLTSIRLPSGRSVVYTYDAKGNLLSEANTPAVGPAIVTSYTYTSLNLVDRITRPTGDSVQHFYDAAGNLIRREVRDASNNLVDVETSTWDAQARRLTRTNGAGVTTTYGYSAFSDLISERLPSGATQQYSWDASGNLIAYFDALGARTDLEYDAYNKLTAIRQGASVLSRYTWNEFGKMATSADGLGNVTRYAYNCTGSLISVTDPRNNVHSYTRSPREQIAAVTDAAARVSSYTHDAAGREILKQTPDGGLWSSSWSPDSVIAQITRPTGATIQATYDGYGRLATETRPERSITYTFDSNARMLQASDAQPGGTFVTQFTWDAANRMKTATHPSGKSIALSYNLAGQRTSLTAPDGGVITYSYNADGLLSEVASGALWTRFTYDANGRRASLSHSNGAGAVYSYNAKNQLTSLVLRDGTGAVARSWSLSYDAAGRRTFATLDDGSIAWTYDDLNRLTGEHIQSIGAGTRLRSWSYDAAGNRLDNAPVFGADHRLLSNSSAAFGYDANGNQTAKGATSRTFDSMNQMTQSGIGLYFYDLFGRHSQRQFNIEYVYDENRIVQTLLNGAPRERFVLHPGTGEPLFQTGPAGTFFYLNGLLQSVNAITNAAGAVVQRYDYDAWGEILRNNGSFTFVPAVTPFNPFAYASAHYDADAAVYLMGPRAYDPALGRFLQKDPASGSSYKPSTQHPYIYARNNPLMFVDPTGMVAAGEYAFLIKKNNLVKASGALIGTGVAYSAGILYFIGDLLGKVTPTGFDLVSAWKASAKAAESYGESVTDAFEYYNSDETAIGDGIINGLQAGGAAGCGVTAPGAPSVMPNGFGHNPQLNGVGGLGIQPKGGAGGVSLSPAPPSILGFQAGGLACGNALANAWLSANAP